MSQNPADLDRAIESLRNEMPPEGASQRALRRLSAPRKSWHKTPLIFVAAGAAVLFVALYPHKTTGSAWAQVVQNTNKAPRCHRVSYWSNGRVSGEVWTDGPKCAFWGCDKNQNVFFESRYDGKVRFNYFYDDFFLSHKTPNSQKCAFRITASHGRGEFPDDYTEMLKQWSGKTVEKTESTPDRITYKFEVVNTIRTPQPGGSKVRIVKGYGEAVVDPKTNLIQSLRSGRNSIPETFSYPESIDPSIFEPRSHFYPHLTTYDLNIEKSKVDENLRKGLGRHGAITLRSVALDPNGSLWVMWTGYRPDGRLSRPVRVIGVPCEPAFAPRLLTVRGNQKSTILYQLVGAPLCGMAQTPKVALGKFVDLKIPTAKGYETFRHVPVMRVFQPPYAELLRGS